MVSESKRFFFLNLFHLCDGILLAMCDGTVVVTLVESRLTYALVVHLTCFKMAFTMVPFSRLTGEYESSIIQQSMLLQCHSRSQSLDELISIVAVTMIFRPQLLCKGIMKRKPLKKFSCFAMMHS